MQDTVYQSKEVQLKLADFLVSLQRFYGAETRSIEGMLNEAECFLKNMKREYFPPLWEQVLKMNDGKNSKSGVNNESK